MIRLRNVARTALFTAVALISIVGLCLPANAQSGNSSGTGVAATAQWDWVNTASISVYYRLVDDVACDDNEVYMYLQAYTAINNSGVIARLGNNKGCNHGVGDTNRLRWDASANITKVRVWACVDDFGGDSCWWRDYDNPNT